jgi:transposase
MTEKQKHIRRTFNEQFKADTVRLVEQEGLKVAHVARDLGIHPNTLHVWLADARSARAGDDSTLGEDEKSELARLRRENRILREEREILKKAAAFFAKESR